MIIEMRDGVLKEFTLWEFLRFMLFMPTFSSGPIDRFKRFNEDYKAIPEREELLICWSKLLSISCMASFINLS